MSDVLTPTAARRRFLIITFLRWFPVGLIVGLMTLLPLERGLSVSQTLLAFSFQGLVVLALELPTGGLADTLGRRPVLVAAAVVNIGSSVLLLVADSFVMFAAAAALQGVFRALDSGPLEAWYVDTVHATEPGADVDGALAAQGVLLGMGLASGALLSGGLVLWDPLPVDSALLLPFLAYTALAVLYLAAVATLMKEDRPHLGLTRLRRALDSGRATGATVRAGVLLVRRNRVLRGLVLVEVFWSVGMIVFETFQSIRLAELVGGEERAGAVVGPAAAAAWGIFAVGSAAAGLASKRLGVARTAVLARVLNGLGAVVMGLVAGPVALIVAYLFTYSLHGAAGPMHAALLHREASASNRATVLSLNSMVASGAFALGAPLLGILAGASSTQVAMVAAGAFSILGAACYLPALRSERAPAAAPVG
jgi:MFS family permease